MGFDTQVFETAIQETNTIIGNFNKEAFVGMQNTLRSNRRQFKPLLLYGPSGRGKTHLLKHSQKVMENKIISSRSLVIINWF